MTAADRVEDHEQVAIDAAVDHVKMIRAKILHILTIYPKVSPSMLQVAIGPTVSPQIWHPILDSLVEEGVINKRQVQSTTPNQRTQVFTIIELAQQQ